MKVNIDGGIDKGLGRIYAGDVMRDLNGNWLGDFSLNKDTLNLLLRDANENHLLSSLICSYKWLINGNWSCVGRHIFKDNNIVADCLADLGKNLHFEAVFYEELPAEITRMLVSDASIFAIEMRDLLWLDFSMSGLLSISTLERTFVSRRFC
ncbi:hypothetical protein ACOSQ2_021069 [Xanthoceras sorbifolium]